jgi:DNA repair protein RadA/Sms
MCAKSTPQWFDVCPSCRRFNTCTIVRRTPQVRGVRLSDLAPESRERLHVRADWDEALGGGLLEQTIVLVSGKPGSGKTSDCLSIAAHGGNYSQPSLYLSSEWKPPQLAARCKELFLPSQNVMCETVEAIPNVEQSLSQTRARIIVLDSWGALLPAPTPEDLDRLRSALDQHATLLVILHATKDGDFSGEEKLLHKADALIWVEPETLVVMKNWHGPPDLEVQRHTPNFQN